MLFFQVFLLAGYAYAHLSIRSFSPRWQALIHAGLLAVAAMTLPVIPAEGLKPQDHDLGFFIETIRKEGAHRPVDEARCQGFLFRWPRLTLEEAARNFPRGEVFLTIIDSQWKKIQSLPNLCVHNRTGQNHGVAISHHH